MSAVTVMEHAFRAGIADYRAIFTWRSWLLGWMLRVIAQVSFFALIGLRVADERSAFYLLIGNALAVAAQTGVFSLNMTTTERWAGTLPLLVASPTSPVVVFSARGAYLAVDGSLSALGALFIAGPLFGLHLPWPRVLAVVPAHRRRRDRVVLLRDVPRRRRVPLPQPEQRRGARRLCRADDGVRRERAAVVLPDARSSGSPASCRSTNGLLAIRGVFDGEAWSSATRRSRAQSGSGG